jgi:membrane-associated phospholipid phosphatase
LIQLIASPRLRIVPPLDPNFSYPYTESETIPVWLLFLLTIAVPLLLMLGVVLLRHSQKRYSLGRMLMEIHAFCLAFVTAIILSQLITNALKFGVGRIRPDFLSRPEEVLKEGRLSFPSGHSSLSFNNLVFLGLWLAGQLKTFVGATHLWKFSLSFLPVTLATFIAASRLIDYRHHFSDVAFGAGLGAGIAIVSYLMFYESMFSVRTSGVPKQRSNRCFEPELEEGKEHTLYGEMYASEGQE